MHKEIKNSISADVEVKDETIGEFAVSVQMYSPRAIIMRDLVKTVEGETSGIDTESESNYNNIRGDNNVSQDTEILGDGRVSAVGGSGNGIRQQGQNTAKLKNVLGRVSPGQGTNSAGIRAGDSGWAAQSDAEKSNKFGLAERIRGKIHQGRLADTDTAGRKLGSEVLEGFKNTVLKDENGRILSFFHFTQEQFEAFEQGDVGFHFGTLQSAIDRMTGISKPEKSKIIKEVYVNITNPLICEIDSGFWDAYDIAIQAFSKEILNESDLEYLRGLKGYNYTQYFDEAAVELRRMLKEKGYDGVIYQNQHEDIGNLSVIAFDNDQILTVAENGTLKENTGVSAADSDESVFSLGEGADSEPDVIDVPEKIWGVAISNENKKRHHTTQAEQQYLREVANAIGVKLDFAHIAEFLKQRNVTVKGITPDAVVTGDGHIVIGFNVTKPVEALLKHELSDYLFMNLSEADAQELMNTAMDTKLFDNWLKSKGYSNATEYSADIIAIRQAVNDPNFVGKSDNDLEYQSYIEMTSDFIAEQCFGGETSINGLVEAINQKKGILDRISQWLKNLIAKIKNHGIPSLETELGQVERQFAKAFNSVNGQNKNTADSGVRFSINNDFISKAEKIMDGTLVRKDNSYITVSNNTPQILIDKAGAKDLPIIISYESLYLALRESGELKGHYHNLGVDFAEKILTSLNNPYEIIKISDNRINEILYIPNKKGENVVVSVEFNAPKEVGGKYDAYNLIITLFGANKNYVQNIEQNGEIIYKKSSNSESQVNRGLYKYPAIVNDSELNSNDIISNSSEKVNNNDMQETENNSEIRMSVPVEKQFAKAFNSVNGQNKNTADSGVRFSIAESFQKTLNHWDKKTVGFSFVVGNTSKVLKEAGISDKQIRLDATKVKALLEKHSGMTIETISQIPELLEKPIFVIDSKSNENAKIVMGDLYDENGKIVTVVLLLTPTSKKGNQLDIIKISSAEGRSHIESLFKNTDGSNVTVRYMDKKRVQDWLNVNRLQLPLHSFNLNSNDIISNSSEKVNNNDMQETENNVHSSMIGDTFLKKI